MNKDYTIQILYSTEVDSKPLVTDLELGELAVNLKDRMLYLRAGDSETAEEDTLLEISLMNLKADSTTLKKGDILQFNDGNWEIVSGTDGYMLSFTESDGIKWTNVIDGGTF